MAIELIVLCDVTGKKLFKRGLVEMTTVNILLMMLDYGIQVKKMHRVNLYRKKLCLNKLTTHIIYVKNILKIL